MMPERSRLTAAASELPLARATVWRCPACGATLGLILGREVIWRQATRRGVREVTAALPCRQVCACGHEASWPPAAPRQLS